MSCPAALRTHLSASPAACRPRALGREQIDGLRRAASFGFLLAMPIMVGIAAQFLAAGLAP